MEVARESIGHVCRVWTVHGPGWKQCLSNDNGSVMDVQIIVSRKPLCSFPTVNVDHYYTLPHC